MALVLTIALGIGSDVAIYGFIHGLTRYRFAARQVAAGISRIGGLLGFGAGLVFFIACANIVSFLLGLAFTRSADTSLRVAFGASRWQLARELLSDSIVISLAGGVCGVLLAIWTSRLVPAFLFEQDAERLVFAPDLLRVLSASAAGLLLIILCGLAPVFLIPYERPAAVLRRESAGSSALTGRLRQALVVAQMTSCCLLLISTAFLFDGFRAALRTNLGHSLGEPVLASVQAQSDNDLAFFKRVEQSVNSVRGFSAWAWVEQSPGNQPVWRSLRVESKPSPVRDVTMDIAWFTPGSLKSFTLPPKAGRLFGFQDQGCRVAIVNEQAAAELFGRSAKGTDACRQTEKKLACLSGGTPKSVPVLRAFPENTVGRVIRDFTGLPVEIIGVLSEKAQLPTGSNHPTIYFNHTDQTGPIPARVALAHFRAPVPSDLPTVELDTNVVSPDYFDIVGLSLIAGRQFTDAPIRGECRVGVINREAAERYFGDHPIGAAVIDDRGVRTAIIGVVRSKPIGTFQRSVEPAIYFPMRQDCPPRMTLIAGAQAQRARLLPCPFCARSPEETSRSSLADLRSRIESVPGRGPAPVIVETLATHLVHTALAPLRIATVVIGASATAALLLSTLGLFGALSDAARQRRRELAIRIALGAQRRRIVYEVLKEGGRLAAAGSLAGILISLALSRVLAHITPAGTSPALWVWLVAPLVLGLGVVIASILPARRALLVNPVTIMRTE